LPHEEDQQLPAAVSSDCAFFGAFEMQFSSHDVFPLHPWTHVMMATHAWSWAHACVCEQHWDMTQLAHEALTNPIPQAAIMPPPLPPLPPPPPLPPLPPPFDPLPPPIDRHALLQLCWTQLLIPCAEERHDGLVVIFDMQACDVWAATLYWPFGQ
jgi:hypothetical protein